MTKKRIKIKTDFKNKQDKNLSINRIKLPNNIRLGVIGFIFLLLMFSAFNVNAANQKPENTEQITQTLNYNQNTNFDYTVFLKNNTVYNGKTTLTPADNSIIFRNIVENIQGSFTYRFQASEKINEITGKYKITAKLETDLWKKQYILSEGDLQNPFTVDFPIDYEKYENITSQIDAETGVTASNPQLTIECNIYNVRVETKDYSFDPGRITPSITLSLNKKTVDISDTLRTQISGIKTEKEETKNQEVIDERNTWTSNSYIFLIIIIIFSLFTKSDAKSLSDAEKKIQKIMKKYDEWIVEISNNPKTPLGVETIYMKSFEDLMKISEEIGKPVLYFKSGTENIYSFHIVDEDMHYRYNIETE